jgi:hypothetical protein
VLSSHAGSDVIDVAENVVTPAVLDAGQGDDVVRSGSGRSILIGGDGQDDLRGGAGEDVVVGDATSLSANALAGTLATWTGGGNYASRVGSLRSLFSDALLEDGDADVLDGAGARDWYLDGLLNDTITGRQSGESVN